MAGTGDTFERPEEDRLIDMKRVRQVLGFGVRAVWRHKLLVLAVFAAVFVGGVVIYRELPRTYGARTDIQVGTDPNRTSLVNPRRIYARNEGVDYAAALQGAQSHAFLMELIEQKDLVAHWEANRSGLQLLRDRLVRAIRGELTPEQRTAIMLGTLDDRLYVDAKKDGTITFGITWPEPVMARELVTAVRERFLELRRGAERASTEGAVTVLEAGLAEARERMDFAVKEVESERARLRKGSKSATVRGLQADGRWRSMPDPQLMELRTQILARRNAIAALDAQRRTRLAATESELTELRTRYGEAWPGLVDTERRLEVLRAPSAEVGALRTEEQQLLSQFVGLGGKETDLLDAPDKAWPMELEDGDPRLATARERLRLATNHYADLVDRLDTARLELASAATDFDARHQIVRAAALPLEPDSPELKKTVGAALVAGVLLAILAAVLIDLRRGVLRERWQVERALRAPVLAEVVRQ